MKTRRITIALATITAILAPATALGQSVSTTAQWERPYGVASGQETQAWSGASSSAGAAASAGAASRSTAGNRVIIDGVIQTGVGVSSHGGLFGGGVGSGATAIGNQLNVNVSGQYNTVIVNSTQINNGDINASAQSDGNVSSDND
ncbi:MULTISPECIES: holdfast anchoring protein HfaA [Alphaproteobacteria]|uniref:holdfast anchoring protein HfaA n=1 Tax=Alphaproteobacteria TaxID=28211 RepID=UPI003A90C2D8